MSVTASLHVIIESTREVSKDFKISKLKKTRVAINTTRKALFLKMKIYLSFIFMTLEYRVIRNLCVLSIEVVVSIKDTRYFEVSVT